MSENHFRRTMKRGDILPILDHEEMTKALQLVSQDSDYDLLKGNFPFHEDELYVKTHKQDSFFETELDILQWASHPNIIKMLGIGVHLNYPNYIVYEWPSNQLSLEDHLLGNGRQTLKWRDRVNIAIKTARVLHFLHEPSADNPKKVIHLNIQSKSVILDHNFQPKAFEHDGKLDIDPKLKLNDIQRSELKRMITCAENCLRPSSYDRPTMKMVAQALEGEIRLKGKWIALNTERGVEARPSQAITEYCFDGLKDATEYFKHISPYTKRVIEAGPSQAITEHCFDGLNDATESFKRFAPYTERGVEGGPSQAIPEYSFDDLSDATESFKNQLGRGGFGHVYYGTLLDVEVAIKRIFAEAIFAEKTFRQEIDSISKTEHPNVIKILGCCSDPENRMIVLEYMPNKSLRYHLLGNTAEFEWWKRWKIALGSAKGLEYLHSLPDKIIHRDFKPENILLDEDFEPKIADFGLARFIKSDSSHVSTNPNGTSGYKAPECQENRRVTEKADVFSLGVVLLQLLTGKRDSEGEGKNKRYIFDTVLGDLEKFFEKETDVKLLDVKLVKEYRKDKNVRVQVSRMIYCAAASVYKPEKERPTMTQIVNVLEGPPNIWDHNVDHMYLRNPYGAS